MNFIEKLKFGNKYECDFAACYKAIGFTILCYTTTFANDVIIQKNNVCKTYEIKSDQKSEYTGNWAFETAQGHSGNISGICASQADYYVIYSHQHYHVYNRIELLQQLLKAGTEGYDIKITGGDNCNVLMLINREKLMNDLPPKKIIKMRNLEILEAEKKDKNIYSKSCF